MSKRVEFERSYLSDIKKMTKRGFDKDALDRIVELLESDEKLPVRCRPHKLVGKYNGLWECHVRHDLLLIWQETEDLIILLRLGNHVEIFGK
ncbi:MAG: type II toxin-antitoxin system YafQ family toxin [Candidatus Pacebacteria bacterium]|nr:type II toxin-antitoxin system YafQ family toxin [Candidatus Paceibacterota bacterium]